MALFDDASLVVTPNGYKAGTLYSIKPTSGAGDMTVVRATTATRVNSAGLIESVANNVPRLDYLNASCPSILIESQRTNSALYSEQFDNAAWVKSNTTITANTTISPDGTQNADTLAFAAFGDARCEVNLAGTFENQSHTITVYAKVVSGSSTFRLKGTHAGVVNYISNDFTATTDWQRFTFTVTFGASLGTGIIYAIQNGSNGTAKNVIFYGFQLELNSSYPTSYIPTTSAAVTRNGDAIYKTGISALIGQTEGTLFLYADIQKHNESDFYIAISNGASLGDAIYLYQPSSGNIQILTRKTGNGDGTITIADANWTAGLNKVAIAYTATTIEVFINGVSKGSTTFTALPTLSQLTIGSRPDVVGTLVGTSIYSEAVVFPTRLTNSECISLTT